MKIAKNTILIALLIFLTILLINFYEVHYTLKIGISFLISLIVAETLYDIGIPRLSSFLTMGLLLGPNILNIFDYGLLNKMKFLDNIALGLIALVAGCEIDFKKDLESFIRYGKYTFLQILIMSLISIPVLYIIFLLLSKEFALLAPVIFLTIIFNATSPSTTIAIIKETKSNNELSHLVLTSAIIKDIALILLFTAALSFFAANKDSSVALVIFHETLSILSGIILGFIIKYYVKFIKINLGSFLLIILITIGFITEYFHLNNLLLFLIAGIIINNFSNYGKLLNEITEQNFELILLIFFFSAGASIDIFALKTMLFITIVLVFIRIAILYISSISAGKLFNIDDKVAKYSTLGFISQAGVSLGFAKIISYNFAWGKDFGTLLFAMIGLNQIAGPLLFKLALSNFHKSDKQN
ncbi:conserved hypothetical protein [Deferribacter desulfuricans SSM1]|uniref:Cation/H+ exchanger transmembrane domain-containing protein n=1 Tax=Deferribacter desulfuricans (strain DSM 14783 / JCM 11476 / NBRC 101012 / SSM1) TaxID=639282 RepID=D3P8S1_DEFDS|nr:cation:proton antiporter [Deferribacter desulfuricans]BAI81111.1 conserved hypothetical protein [Deferribacter desulfuricans SSM1]